MESKQNTPNTDTAPRIPTLDNLTTAELIRLAKASAINAIKAGKSGMARELENLLALEARVLSPSGGGKGEDKSEIRNPQSEILFFLLVDRGFAFRPGLPSPVNPQPLIRIFPYVPFQNPVELPRILDHVV